MVDRPAWMMDTHIVVGATVPGRPRGFGTFDTNGKQPGRAGARPLQK